MAFSRRVPGKLDITRVQGDDWEIPLTLKRNGAPIDLGSYSFLAQIRKSEDRTSDLVLTFTVEPTDLVNGMVTLSAARADTANIVATKAGYVWEVEWIDDNNKKRSGVRGRFYVEPEVAYV